MKSQKILEQRITEAVDGKLNPFDLEQLQVELRDYPELQNELAHQLRGIPVSLAYKDVQPDPFAISRLRNRIKALPENDWQFEIIHVFKRYVLAAGLAALLMVSAIHAIPQQNVMDDQIDDEISIMFESLESEALDWTSTNNGQKP